MRANDLRIGNYVEYGDDIEQITIHHLFGVLNGDDVKPIPLTEEWLLSFGFELINNEFYRSRNSELCLHWTVNKNKMIPEYNEKRFVTGYDFKYVHQLQNLYFALTGEELTLKEI